MASLSNSMWQNRKERPNGPTNNWDMVDKAKRALWVSEGVSLWHLSNNREAELLINIDELNAILRFASQKIKLFDF